MNEINRKIIRFQFLVAGIVNNSGEEGLDRLIKKIDVLKEIANGEYDKSGDTGLASCESVKNNISLDFEKEQLAKKLIINREILSVVFLREGNQKKVTGKRAQLFIILWDNYQKHVTTDSIIEKLYGAGAISDRERNRLAALKIRLKEIIEFYGFTIDSYRNVGYSLVKQKN